MWVYTVWYDLGETPGRNRWEKGKFYFKKLNSKLQIKTKQLYYDLYYLSWNQEIQKEIQKVSSLVGRKTWNNNFHYLPQYFTITHISESPSMPSLLSKVNSFTSDGENQRKDLGLLQDPCNTLRYGHLGRDPQLLGFNTIIVSLNITPTSQANR